MVLKVYPILDFQARTLVQSQQEFLGIDNENCYQDNTDPDGQQPASFFAFDLTATIPLPTGGCGGVGSQPC